jgi:hypothetical protein
MDNLFKRVQNNNMRLSLYHDTNAENPRYWDSNVGTMVCWHSKYRLGDKQFATTESKFFFENLATDVLGMNIDDDKVLTKEQREEVESKIIFLPVYMFDHSGITISTTPFGCKWDSGQIGYIYVTKEKAERVFGLRDADLITTATEHLNIEVEIYNDYLAGDVYRYTLEVSEECSCCKHCRWDVVESEGGFYGSDLKDNGLYDSVTNCNDDFADLLKLL